MAKFGLFSTTRVPPFSEYEGDYIKRDGEYVEVRKYGTADQPTGVLIAAIRLDKGQDVRTLPE
jgi:hypothetical protein